MMLLAFLIAAPIFAASATVSTTATQAIISYPDISGCTLDVREAGASSVVPDVDATLFTGSNLDSRSTSNTLGGTRQVVVGQRAAQKASNNRFVSRALQAATHHTYTITCTSNVYSGDFWTTIPPLGQTYPDVAPVDPANPGQYAWPQFDWTTRGSKVIDPTTGTLLSLFDSPRDNYTNPWGVTFSPSAAAGTGWTLTSGNLPGTYSGSSSNWLFLDFGHSDYQYVSNLEANVTTINATLYGSGAGSTAATRNVDVCLSLNRTSCESDVVTVSLPATSGNVTLFATPLPILADWFASRGGMSTINNSDLAKRVGTVSRTTTTVTWYSGPQFNLRWAGGTITIGSTTYTIASVNSEVSITLTSGSGSDAAGTAYSASNGGLLVRKSTASTDLITLTSVAVAYEVGSGAYLESGGDETNHNSCSSVTVTGPASEIGRHCVINSVIVWVGKTTRTVNRIGSATTPFTYDGINPGYNISACGSVIWDYSDGDSFYCNVYNNSNLNANMLQYDWLVLKWTYTGGNTDIGDIASGQTPVLCGSTTPCWTLTNLTTTTSVNAQMAAAHPLWSSIHFQPGQIILAGRMSSANALVWVAKSGQDSMSFIAKWNLATAAIVAEWPTWSTLPQRWSTDHGYGDLNNPNWITHGGKSFQGPFSGNDNKRLNGPYYSTVTSAVSATPGSCPAQPGGNTLPNWPTGNHCETWTVDGEPGDPSPYYYSGGTVTIGSAGAVTLVGGTWDSTFDNSLMYVNGNYYSFRMIQDYTFTHGTLTGSPSTGSGLAYTLYLDSTIRSGKTGDNMAAYLQDAAPGDIACVGELVNTELIRCQVGLWPYYIPGYYPEYVRILTKTGNTWVVEKGYAGTNAHTASGAHSAGAGIAFMVDTACDFSTTYVCSKFTAYWNPSDTYATNPTGTTIITNNVNDLGCCHGTSQNVIADLWSPGLPNRDGVSAYYAVQPSTIPTAFSLAGIPVNLSPLFHGVTGFDYPNTVDLHPGHQQEPLVATANDFSWIGDARVFLGSELGDMTGSAGSPGTNVEGTLYKFTSAQTSRMRRKTLPTIAACGINPLLDVSGPSSHIVATSGDNYKYCVANAAGECRGSGETGGASSAGDVFVNCPQISTPYCYFPGVGNESPEKRDICIGDAGAYSNVITQVGYTYSDPDSKFTRKLTGMARYRTGYQFWNVKIFPDGQNMMVPQGYLQGVRNTMTLAKLPPWPASSDSIPRNDYEWIPVNVAMAATGTAYVRFGYAPNLYCGSRNEICVSVATAPTASPEYYYAGETYTAVSCTASSVCTILVPAIPQRVLYVQPVSNGVPGLIQAIAIP